LLQQVIQMRALMLQCGSSKYSYNVLPRVEDEPLALNAESDAQVGICPDVCVCSVHEDSAVRCAAGVSLGDVLLITYVESGL